MKIAIIGTRGIPNHYGGFEQFAEYLSVRLVELGHHVTVYNSHTHPYQEKTWNNVNIIHCKDPEDKIGTAGQFIYDLNCILDTRKKKYDIILQLGYTSSSIWGKFLPRKKSKVITNMDGLEWKRTKYSKKVQKFLFYAEKLGVKYSDHLVSDSIGIQSYIQKKYNRESTFIPYGANIFEKPDHSILEQYELLEYGYNMLIARLEPENNIETILDGVVKSNNNAPFLVIGKHETKFGEYLKNKFQSHSKIRFLGGIYDLNKLNNLRHYSNIYFHGHTVGGTNPSLLEAMASSALICAHKNIFNESIIGSDGFYFENTNDIVNHLNKIKKEVYPTFIINNLKKIETTYSWENINQQYLNLFEKCCQ
jgi:glycosyltransferase involved in cell wall biosynthesis